jgi:hypothetical protein
VTSQHVSPDAKRFQSYYVGLQSKWNRQRYKKLCCKLNYTPEETGAVFGLTPAEVRRYLDKNKFPKPVCRLLNCMDDWLELKRGNVPEHNEYDEFLNKRLDEQGFLPNS